MREIAFAWAGFALLCAIAFALVGRDLAVPGFYYDEVIQAEPAVRFLTADPMPLAIPGAEQVRVAGRWFPLMTQPYMGALKSQLLIPIFALAGSEPVVIRVATLCWALIGLGAFVVWARRAYDPAVGLLAAALLAVDPSFLFVSRHDWGSFALGFACRCGALALLCAGWRARGLGLRARSMGFAGGALLGLGVYNKIDFAVVVIGMAIAWAAVRPEIFAQARARAADAACAAAGALAGLAPLLSTLGSTITLTQQALAREGTSSDLAEKWHTWSAMFNGSYFHELMLAGGNFRALADFDGGIGPFGVAFALAWLAGAVRAVRRRASGGREPAREFALLCALLIPIGLLLTPRAIRIHHALLVYPFPQLVVAIAAVDLWRSRVLAARSLAVLGTSAVVAGSLVSTLTTLAVIRETGGKGRWSNAIGSAASDCRDGVAVALDWGFALPMRFEDRSLAIFEPIWALNDAARERRVWEFAGDARERYLVFEPRYAVFRFGDRFLTAVDALPPGSVEVRRYTDGAGDVAFRSIRIRAPHRIRYTGRFEIALQPGGSSP